MVITDEVPGLRVQQPIGGVGMARLRGGTLSVPRLWHAQANWTRVPHVVDIDVEVVDGRPVCMKLVCTRRKDGPPVTNASLRQVPVERIIARSAQLVICDATPGDGCVIFEPRIPDDLSVLAEDRKAITKAGKRPRRRHRLTDEFLAQVADRYRVEVAQGAPAPCQELADHYAQQLGHPVSRATIHRWILAARKRQFLGPTSPGRKGER